VEVEATNSQELAVFDLDGPGVLAVQMLLFWAGWSTFCGGSVDDMGTALFVAASKTMF